MFFTLDLKKLINILLRKRKKTHNNEYTVVKFKDRERGEFRALIPNDEFEENILEIEEDLKGVENYKDDNFIWCLVGNIVEEREYGANKELRKGTKHFAPNAKVFCFPALWGDGYERIMVIGQPRRKRKMITVIIPSIFVTNWRVKKVFHPYVKYRMLTNNGWDGTRSSKIGSEDLCNILMQKGNKKSGEQ